MGDEVSLRTKRAFEEALTRFTSTLDDSLEDEKFTNHFLTGVPAIVEGLRTGKIHIPPDLVVERARRSLKAS